MKKNLSEINQIYMYVKELKHFQNKKKNTINRLNILIQAVR